MSLTLVDTRRVEKTSFSRLFLISTLILGAILFNPAGVHAKPGPECWSLLRAVQIAEKETAWNPQRKVFSNTVASTVVSSVFWLSLVEAIRQAPSSDPHLTSTFKTVLPLDVLVSLASHTALTRHFPLLQRILSAGTGAARWEGLARTGTISILNTAIISMGWALWGGVDVGGTQVAGAFGLCAGVYTGLYQLKKTLFDLFPFGKDCHYQSCLLKEMEQSVVPVFDAARARAQELGVSAENRELWLISALEAALTSQEYEEQVAEIPSLSSRPKLQKSLSSLRKWVSEWKSATDHSEEPYARYIQELMRLRRQLLNLLLDIESEESGSEEAQKIRTLLVLGEGFDESESLRFHQVFRERTRDYLVRLKLGSFVQQGFAVGIAGGVLLSKTTEWAQRTGAGF